MMEEKLFIAAVLLTALSILALCFAENIVCGIFVLIIFLVIWAGRLAEK